MGDLVTMPRQVRVRPHDFNAASTLLLQRR